MTERLSSGVCIQEAAGFLKDPAQHRSSETTRKGILLARVVGRDQGDALGKPDLGAVEEAGLRLEGSISNRFPRSEKSIEGDPSERDHHADTPEKPELGLEIRLAVRHLPSRGLVSRRSAADRCSDVRIPERKAVACVRREGLGGEAGAVKRSGEPLPAPVSREHPAGAVASVGRGREPHDQEAGFRVAEPRERAGPVTLALVPVGWIFGHGFPVAHQTRAEPAGDDLSSERGERSQG